MVYQPAVAARLPYGVAGPRLAVGGEVPPRTSRQWFVRVDGWSLSFDGVDADRLPALAAFGDDDEEDAAGFSSPYDAMIVRYASKAGLDWRLVSAVIYEESRFEPDSVSEGGAHGLMQVREVAARAVGAESFYAPEANIRVGVRYLKHLEAMFAGVREVERLPLMLAAYNMGPGHVADAQTLAKRFGFDPLRWYDSMERVLPLLEQPALYEQLPNGYARGRATVKYVRRVLDRYARDRRDPEIVSRPAADQAASARG